MDVPELTQAAALVHQGASQREREPYDHEGAYALLGKTLGIVIRRQRLGAERTLSDCAALFQLPGAEIEAWELGERAPSLPQLQRLAQFFDDGDSGARDGEYWLLRQRMTGALLRKARESAGRGLPELSADTALGADLLLRYELGEAPIPLHHLSLLAQILSRDLAFFAQDASAGADPPPHDAVPTQSDALAEDESAAPPDEHAALIRLAIAFRDIDPQTLQQVAEALAALIQARDAAQGAQAAAT